MKKSLLLGSLTVALAVCACCDPGGIRAGDQKQGKLEKLETLLKNLGSDEENVRLDAIIHLQDHSSKAITADPALAKAFAKLLTQAFADKNEDIRLNAALALGKFGKTAIPELKKSLTSADEDVRYYALSAVGWIGPDAQAIAPQVIASLNHKSESVRRKAAYALGSIAPGPKVALPVLIKAFSDDNADVRQAASEAVSKFGASAVPALMEALRESSLPLRQQAVRALGDIGSDAKNAVPSLRALLFETGGKLQSEAAEALGKIGKDSIPVLIEATKNDNATVRQLGVTGLNKVGAVAVPDLVDALGSKFVDVRRQAASALAPQRINDKMVVLGLAYALKDEDEQVRITAVNGLQQLQLGAKLAAPMLTAALVDSNVNVRRGAYYSLSSMGMDPKPGLVKGLQSKDAKVRINTASLMVEVNYQPNEAFTVLREGLKEKDKTLQMTSAYYLAQRHQDVDTILPILTTALKSKSLGVREQGVQGLQFLGTKASSAAPALLDVMLKDENTTVRQQAVNALQNIGGDTKLMMPALQKLMKDGDASLRLTVVQLAWRHGREGLKLLLAAQNDKDANVRQQAVWALYNVQGNDLKDYVPEIAALMKNKDNNIRQAALHILARAGEAGQPYLLEALKDGDHQVRWNAFHNLRNNSTTKVPTKKLAEIVLGVLENAKDPQQAQFGVQAVYQLGQEYYGPALEKLKKVKTDEARAGGIQVLGYYGNASKDALPFLIESLKSKSKEMRWSAASALNHMNVHAKPALPELTKCLKDEEQNVRQNAFYAIASMGTAGLSGLIEATKMKDENLRLQAIHYITNQGQNAKEAVPALVEVVNTGKIATHRAAACNALANINMASKEVVQTLTAASTDSNATVRQAAQNALNRLQPKKK